MTSVHDFTCDRLNGKPQDLADYKGKVLLVVNTASKCGFTPQFEGLEKLFQDLKDKGLVILGFPCNQFGKQDPGSNDEIGEFCQINCGFTPQFEGLEKLFQDLKDKGLVILGFPCNQFGKQDPGSNDEIGEFCQINYGVSFPMFAKIDVNGDGASPLYKHLKAVKPGVLGTERIKWNFTKFLVDRDGNVVKRFAPKTKPEDIRSAIEALL